MLDVADGPPNHDHRRQSSSAAPPPQPSPFAIGRRVLRPSPSTSALAGHPPSPLSPTFDVDVSLPPSQQQQHRQPRSKASLSRLFKKPSLIGPLLRGMQSFDSGRTERPPSSSAGGFSLPVVHPPDTPPRADPAARNVVDARPEVLDGRTTDAHEVWDWLAKGAEDDPRFVLWRTVAGPLGPRQPPPTSPTSPVAPLSPHAPTAAASTSFSSTSASASTAFVADAPRLLLAATAERWVHHLTSVIDPDGAFDFFLVYRSFCSPSALLALLTSRFEWACSLSPATATENDAAASSSSSPPPSEGDRMLARSRTILILAFWLTNFFADDWLADVALRRQLASWLNAMRALPALDGVLGARSLLRKLKAVVKERKATFDTPSGKAAYDARAMTVVDGAGGLNEGVVFPAGSSSADPALKHSSAAPPNPPTVFPTRRKAHSTFSPPTSHAPLSSADGSGGPPPLNKHTVAKLWGSIGRAATRRTAKLSLSSSSASSSGFGLGLNVEGGGARGGLGSVGSGAYSDASSLDALFDLDSTGGHEAKLAASGTPTDVLTVKGGLEAYLRAYVVPLGGGTGGPAGGKPASLSDPETHSSRSDSTRASEGDAGVAASTPAEHEAAVVEEDVVEVEEEAAVQRPALEKVEEERSSCELSPAERQPSTSVPPSPKLLGSASSLPPLSVDVPFCAATPSTLPRFIQAPPAAGPSDLAPSVDPSPVESTFSAATAASSRSDAPSLASSCSTDDEDFRVRPRVPAASASGTRPAKPTWTPIVPFATIALDDVSLSGSSDEDDDDEASWRSRSEGGGGASVVSPRRLPQGARQLNLQRQSLEALGAYPALQRGSTDSSVVSPTTGLTRTHAPAAGSTASSLTTSSDGGGAWHNSLLARFDLAAVESDESDDDGGFEAALRRLNGMYDVEKRRAREARIEQLVAANRTAWRRHDPLPVGRPRSVEFDLIEPEGGGGGGLAPALELKPPTFPPVLVKAESDPATTTISTPAVEEETGDVQPSPEELASSPVGHSSLPAVSPQTRRLSAPGPQRPEFSPPFAAQSAFALATPGTRARASTQESRSSRPFPQPGPTSPHKPLATGLSAATATSPVKPSRRRSLTKRRPTSSSPGTNQANSAAPRSRSFYPSVQPALRHQSFILSIKTSVLAAQFSMIDAQLLNAIGFDELARKPAAWVAQPLPALDSWEELWREKARWKVGLAGRASDVSMLVRRFELVVRWVETELVLTARAGRNALVTLVERFVKLAAALFQMSNLQTCVAIMQGLQTPLIASVMQAHKAWPKLAMWERRVFKDLRLLTTADGSWANLRKAHASILETHGGRFFENAQLGPAATTMGQGGGGSNAAPARSLTGATRDDGFLPYVGIYLHDLATLDAYPDFVTPRIPGAVRAHLPPLPAFVPAGGTLINVDKATQHAQIIREVCLFKTLSAKFNTVPAEAVPFQLCFKLRAAPPDALLSLAQIATPR